MRNNMNEELLQNWVEEGLVIPDLGDGAWSWTELAKRILPSITRIYLSNLLYSQNLDDVCLHRHMLKGIAKYGFSEDGFVLTDE